MIVWTHGVNWATSVAQNFAYHTEILQSHNGNEQRLAHRIEPRFTQTSSHLFFHEEMQQVMRKLRTDHASVFLVPDYVMHRPCVSAGASEVVYESESLAHWEGQGDTLFLSSKGEWMTAEVASRVTALLPSGLYQVTLTLTEALPFANSNDAVIYRAFEGYMSGTQVTQVTDRVAQVTLTVAERPGTYTRSPRYDEIQWSTNPTLGVEVADSDFNWTRGVSFDITQEFQSLELPYGVVDRPFTYPFTTASYRLTKSFFSYGEVEEFLAFFHRRRGRQKDAYFGCGSDDFTLAEISPNLVTLVLKGEEPNDWLATTQENIGVKLLLVDGSSHVTYITGVSVSGGNTFVTTFNDLPYLLDAHDVASGQFIQTSRFGSDEITITYQSDQFATTDFVLQTLDEVFQPISIPSA